MEYFNGFFRVRELLFHMSFNFLRSLIVDLPKSFLKLGWVIKSPINTFANGEISGFVENNGHLFSEIAV